MRKIGLLIPKTNLTVEYELQHLYNKNYFNVDDYIFYISKLDYRTNYKENKEKFLKDLAEDSNNKIRDLEYLKVNYFSFFCTSSAMENNLVYDLCNPIDSLLESAKLRKVKRCLLITPYNDKIGNELVEILEENNIIVMKTYNLNLIHTHDYFDFGINRLKDFIMDKYKNEYENIIISCTNLPTLKVIEELEIKLNTNIISSNSSMFEKIKRDNEKEEVKK